MSVEQPLKRVVSVTEMAKMVGLSRARFYQLVKAGVFPAPNYDPETKRPYYDEDAQQKCLEVRQRNCGVNGKPVLFYAKRITPAPVTPKRTKSTSKAKANPFADVQAGVEALGLNPTRDQVTKAIRTLFPQGTKEVDSGEVIRAVFLHLKRQDTKDNLVE